LRSLYPILVLLLLLLFNSCGKLTEFENKQVQEALSDSLFTTTESWGINMEVLENGKLKLKLSGSYAASIKDESRNLTKISGPVYIEIFDDEGKPDTFVNADSAVHKPQDAEFELFGNVRVDAPGGKKLRSVYLKWERQRDRVSTPEFVIFISPPDSIAAQGFFGDSDLTNYTLNEGGGRAVLE
jgi:LPS export ABC transporter protein LptC